ncbi:isochorismatase family protein [Lentilactobacillus kosonis]|uniref:Isochorismatase n=1 Tax=Lentilactobacillus kosonis TaxID=2810561 RepID=A0A401FHT6_9LACO|nr:isochorismatase family protein [Lentilactobacillus kosonis]GAY71924.1 isochorismatase [Lentilactobacillus kosonis]
MIIFREDKRALIVIDLQNGVGPLVNNADLIKRVNKRINYYHSHNKPIIFIRHSDQGLEKNSYDWQLVDDLETNSQDYYVDKTHADSFHNTNLQTVLDELKVNELEICGAEIPYCIDATIKAAFDRGYKLFMSRGTVSSENDESIPFPILVEHYEKIWNHRFVEFIDEE